MLLDPRIELSIVLLAFGCGVKWFVSRIWRRGDGLDVYGVFDERKQR